MWFKLYGLSIFYVAYTGSLVVRTWDLRLDGREFDSWPPRYQVTALRPVHTSNNVEATFDFVAKTGNNVERVYRKFRPFENVEFCFGIVAVFLATMLPVFATMSNEILSFWQSRNKLNMFNLFRLCRKNEISFDIVANNGKYGNNVKATFDFVERIVRLVAFDNVVSTLLLVWTFLNLKT